MSTTPRGQLLRTAVEKVECALSIPVPVRAGMVGLTRIDHAIRARGLAWIRRRCSRACTNRSFEEVEPDLRRSYAAQAPDGDAWERPREQVREGFIRAAPALDAGRAPWSERTWSCPA